MDQIVATTEGRIHCSYDNDTREEERVIEANMSEIWSILIREAGRWCESYASDLLHDIDHVRNVLNHPDQWMDGETHSVDFMFGFRQYGVDHKEYVEVNMKDDVRKYYYYRAVYKLTISRSGNDNFKYCIVLTRIV